MQINYQIMTREHLDSVVSCITDAFTKHEPLTSFLHIPSAAFEKHMQHLCHAIADKQLSIVALHDSRVIGARLATHLGSLTIPKIKEMEIVHAILHKLHEEADISLHYHHLHLLMMGVNHAYHNLGIAQKLLEHTLQNAREKGFEYAIVEATTPITQHIFAKKFTFQTLNRIDYRSFRHQGRAVLKNMPGKSPYCALMGGPL